MTTLALLLLVAAAGVGGLAYRDYESTRAVREYLLDVTAAQDDLSSAHRLADRKPPDPDGSRAKIQSARAHIDAAGRSTHADPALVASLRSDADALTDRLDGVVVDLARLAAGARPSGIIGNTKGLYIVDPGTTRLWRISGDPTQTVALLERGTNGIGTSNLLAWQGEVLYLVDDARKVWRVEGDKMGPVTPADAGVWKSATAAAVFLQNLYVLDGTSGQLWKHESNDGATFAGDAIPYLAAVLPPNTARSLAVDGDVWITTTGGEILRFRRNPLLTTAGRIDFAPKWNGDALTPGIIQAVDAQRSIYVLDATGRFVVQLQRDGRELLRLALPTTLPPATAFYVAEGARVAYTIHGSKIVATSFDR